MGRLVRTASITIVGAAVTVGAGCGQPAPPAPGAAGGPKARQQVLINSVGMRLVRLAGGAFQMGHPTFPLAHPVHSVRLSPFWIAQCETTVAQVNVKKKRSFYPEAPTVKNPATRISWNDAADYCKWLSKREARAYRLPTEAEWEYAARGGLVQKDYPWGNDPPEGRAQIDAVVTAPVGSYPPNGFGLFDMAGNVDEWVSDRTDVDDEDPTGGSRYYATSPRSNPTGMAKGEFRVLRSGAFGTHEVTCYLRAMDTPSHRLDSAGFRVCLSDR